MCVTHFFAADDTRAKYCPPETKHQYRSNFERDRDKILYSKSFRRLSGKTQVFVVGYDDHIRTRLTHTLEVAQIARTIARQLQVNEILTEAIALGHDIGHTPFGHEGERTLNFILNGCDVTRSFDIPLKDKQKGFKHNWQGLRVVTQLEKIGTRYNGLNLSNFTRWGIVHHTNTAWKKCEFEHEGKCNLRHKGHWCYGSEQLSLGYYTNRYNFSCDDWTIEALIVKYADEIAQRHHDVEDGLIAGIITRDEVISRFKECFEEYLERQENKLIDEIRSRREPTYYIPLISKLIVNFLVTNLIEATRNSLKTHAKHYDIKSVRDFYSVKTELYAKLDSLVSYQPELASKDNEFSEFLKNRILNSFVAQSMDGKSNYIIRQLIKAYLTNPQQLPDKTIVSLYRNYMSEEFKVDKVGELRERLKSDHSSWKKEYKSALLRTICDHIAGMTDGYALKQFDLLYGTSRIGVL